MESTKKKRKSKCAIMFTFAFPLVSSSVPMVYKPLTNHLITAKATSGVAYMVFLCIKSIFNKEI